MAPEEEPGQLVLTCQPPRHGHYKARVGAWEESGVPAQGQETGLALVPDFRAYPQNPVAAPSVPGKASEGRARVVLGWD